jgi:putative membrane protein
MSEKTIVRSIWAFSAVVYALVIILHELPEAASRPEWVSMLPGLNALINGVCFVLLIGSLYSIKQKNIARHKALNTAAMVLSVVFLLSYVLNHYFSGDTVYQGDMGWLFYPILITHILFAGISLPFILLAYYRGNSDQRDKHKKLVRWVFPVWLYVTFTGVLVYQFLAPYYA